MVREIVVLVLLAGLLEMLLPENNLRKYVKVVLGLFIMVALLVPLVTFISSDESWAVSAWQFTGSPAAETATVLSAGERLSSQMQEAALMECENRLSRQVEALVALVPGVGSVRARVQTKAGPGGEVWSSIEQVQLEIILADPKAYLDQKLEANILPNHAGAEGKPEDPGPAEKARSVTPVALVKIGDPDQKAAALKFDEGRARQPAVMARDFGLDNPVGGQSASQREVEQQAKNIVANFYGVPESKIQVIFR